MRLVLDACVLVPTVMRQVLIGAADAGFFEPLWSARIIEEWRRASGSEPAEIDAALLEARYPSARIAPAGRAPSVTLPDANDLHVLSTAIEANADGIVTLNHKDFPSATLARFGLYRSDPDALLETFLSEDRAAMVSVIEGIAVAAKDHGASLDATQLLRKAGLRRLARAFKQNRDSK